MTETTAWPDRVRVLFRITRDQDGYPPTDYETLWAFHVAKNIYQIDNVPFYVRDLSLGDQVSVIREGGDIVFEGIVAQSSHSSVRVMVRNPADLLAVKNALASLGCEGEVNKQLNMIALDVPDTADISAVFDLLDGKYAKGVLDFEESSVRYK
jgi:hypothetical protein